MGKHVKVSDPGKQKTTAWVRVFENVVRLAVALVKLAQIISEWPS